MFLLTFAFCCILGDNRGKYQQLYRKEQKVSNCWCVYCYMLIATSNTNFVTESKQNGSFPPVLHVESCRKHCEPVTPPFHLLLFSLPYKLEGKLPGVAR